MTICTAHRDQVLARIRAGVSDPTPVGAVVATALQATSQHRPSVQLDRWVLMPDHLHVLFRFNEDAVTGLAGVVRGFKAASTRAVNHLLRRPGTPLWQRNYYEHIVRDDTDLDRIRRYIEGNPSAWIRSRAGRPMPT